MSRSGHQASQPEGPVWGLAKPARRPAPRVHSETEPQVFLEIEMVGNFELKSLALAATLMATVRATAL